MISLQDKIQRFQKLIYNKELDDFIPIDEQFISGGITMQSLIKENAFIVEEIKKMKNVFINYCKLNKNVYEKMTEHQIALHSQTIKLQNISTSIEGRLSDAIKQVKEMYEEMKYESVRTKNLVDEAVRPIEEAINRKVDETSFTMHMKRIIAELDEDNDNPSILNAEQNSSLSPEDLQFRKKKAKSVAYEEYEVEKIKNTKLFMELSQKIEQLQTKNREFDPIIYKNSSALNKLTLTLDNHETEVFKINRDMKEVRAQINNTELRLLTEIHSRTSDNVWELKLSSFETKNVIPRFQNLSNQINKNQRENNRHFADLEPKFIQIKQKINSLFSQTDKNQSEIIRLNQILDQTNKKIMDGIQVIEQKLSVVYQEKKAKIEKIHEKIVNEVTARKKEIESLNSVIKELSKTIEDKVVTGVKKNINGKIQQIEKNIHTLINKQKSLQEQLFVTKGEIHNIKQVLSKKANFSDILVHFERKADKEDFKELKDRMEQTTPSNLKSTIIDNPQKTRRTISASSRKRTSLSKNLANPVSVLNDDKMSLESDNERSSRLFIMGLENDMTFQNDRRRMSFTESTRRKKKMKQNVGFLNLFGN